MTEHTDDLLKQKRAWVEGRRRENAEGVFKARALALPLPPSFLDALRVPRAERALIAQLEVTPGSDLTRIDGLIRSLEAAGVTALAVRGDSAPFGDVYGHLLAAAQCSSLPILCRETVLDPLQIAMARAHGAAAVTLEPSVHPERDLRALVRMASDLGLDVMLVAHSMADMESIARLRRNSGDSSIGRLLGVTGGCGEFRPRDSGHFERMATALPEFCMAVALTDVSSAESTDLLAAHGYEAWLCRVPIAVGEVTPAVVSVAGTPAFA